MTRTQLAQTRRFNLTAAGVALAVLCGFLAAACSPPDCGCELPAYEVGG